MARPDETQTGTWPLAASSPSSPRLPAQPEGARPATERPPSETAFATLAAHLRSGAYRSVQLDVGARVHHYEITDVIGRGGMSRVFGARHVYLGQDVALKTTLEASEGAGTEFAERFLREAQTLAKLNHPNVVRVLDANVWNSIPYVVTERLRGRSLTDQIEHGGRLSVDRTLDVIEDVAAVLERQESLGIVHRDIKPHNLHLREDGTTCVFDYGLVGFAESNDSGAEREAQELTKTGALNGTPAYMAPEQFEGRDIGPWTDIYGLGSAAWHALAGERPRNGKLSELFAQASRAPRSVREVRADVPVAVEHMLNNMLAPQRSARYASAKDLLRDVCDLRYRGRRVQGVARGRVFAAMPFSAAFERVWRSIEDACIDACLRPTRVDRLVYIENIWAQIVQEIANCSVLVADFTAGWLSRAPNANVVTEAAHAVAIKKPVIVISQSPPESLPFDWRHVPVIRYSRSRTGLEELRRVLVERLEQVGRDARAS
jgi:serine/threonine protein kinase